MPYVIPRADAERAERRADASTRLGPYEVAYDTRRGYDLPMREATPSDGTVILFRGREQRRR